MTITKALCVGIITPTMMIVEVLPGVRLLMLPGESIADVVDSLHNHFVETDSMFDPGWELTAEELDELSDRDPNLQRDIAAGMYVPFQEVKPGWAQPAEYQEDYIG